MTEHRAQQPNEANVVTNIGRTGKPLDCLQVLALVYVDRRVCARYWENSHVRCKFHVDRMGDKRADTCFRSGFSKERIELQLGQLAECNFSRFQPGKKRHNLAELPPRVVPRTLRVDVPRKLPELAKNHPPRVRGNYWLVLRGGRYQELVEPVFEIVQHCFPIQCARCDQQFSQVGRRLVLGETVKKRDGGFFFFGKAS